MIIQSSIQFVNPDIGVETTTEHKPAKFPSLTFCSFIYSISVPRVFQNSNATFDDLKKKLPKIKDNVEIILTENAMFAKPQDMYVIKLKVRSFSPKRRWKNPSWFF